MKLLKEEIILSLEFCLQQLDLKPNALRDSIILESFLMLKSVNENLRLVFAPKLDSYYLYIMDNEHAQRMTEVVKNINFIN